MNTTKANSPSLFTKSQYYVKLVTAVFVLLCSTPWTHAGDVTPTPTPTDTPTPTPTDTPTPTPTPGYGEISVISTSGSAVAAAPGQTKYRSFGIPSINDNGVIAYYARISDSAGAGTVPAILVGTTPSVLVKKGETAPIINEVFYNFLNPLVNNDGEVAFVARLGTAGLDPYNDQVLMTTLNGSLAPVLREGDNVPSPAGAVFKFFRQIALSNEYVAIVGDLVTGPGGVTDSTNTGLWLSNGTSISLIIREGDVIDLASGPLTISSMARSATALGTLVPGNIGLGQGNGLVDNQVLMRVRGTDGRQAIIAVSDNGITEIAATATAAPGYDEGAELQSFSLPAQDAFGYTAFLGLAKPGLGGVTTLNNSAIYSDFFGSLERFAMEGSPAPGTSGSFASFRYPLLGSGNVVFQSTLAGSPGSVDFNTNTALYVNNELLAREGSPAPDTNGAVFGSFTSLAMPDNFDLGAMFVAKLAVGPGGVSPANDTGLWIVPDIGTGNLSRRTMGVLQPQFGGTPRLVLREGWGLDGKTIRSFKVLSRVPYSGTQRRSFNSSREIVAFVVFTNNSKAIIKITVPSEFFEQTPF